ncbi:fungal specific transcription factor [Hirsutella rhossiliensis]|uniref:Fungal specific transcription factor domain-containing protein n=1 Tax=Hirsutella rhossiliensis TaxID=111463 RepID=A0A9P8N276_9HYPO|nr:fungal specific transcription factor domain-containing protein [Hirsutella rhossiliensis]KAH0965499.1 fungal specific transcription factor domain-containing protein [Hirsutella rhossiliensis]
MKLTRGTSCVLCQQRKVRCDKNKPCANCVKAGVDCKIIPPAPPRRRKKRLQERDLVDRLKKYESLLSEHGVKFDAIGHDLRSDGPHMDDVEELENDFEGLKTSPEASASPSAASQNEKPRGSWFSLHKEFRASEQLLHDSSEDDIDGSTIHRAFDKMFGEQDGFPFVIGGRAESVTGAHPSTIHILQLWQIYIDNINPLLKITHVPTMQGQIIEATSRLDRAPKNVESLMFAIYVMAITSLEEAVVEKMFGEPKKELLGRYFAALQQALLNAGFMRNTDFICLQAYVLYLYAVRWFVDPRQVFCLIGMAVRMAHRMGLHRDPGAFGLPPFEIEQRRRLWWTIVGYDRRIGEMTGSTVTALSSGGDCKIPLNVNDSDLHVDGKDMPTPHSGPTEMLFALTRIEIAMAVSSNSNRDSFKMNNPEKASPVPQGTPSKPPVPTIRIAGQDSPSYTLDGYCAHIEGTYLTQCDPKIPLHFFTLTMTRQNLCKMRVIGFLVRMHNAEAMPLKEIERDSLSLQATQMIEYDNVVQSSESLQPFRWYAMHHFPFPAYMFLVQELRNRVSGPLVERAWDAIAANYNLRGLLSNLHSPMHTAFGNLFLKAWDAHEASQLSNGRQVTQPRFITILRERAEKRRQARAENRHDPSLEQAPVDFPRSQGLGLTPADSESATSMMTPPSVDHSMMGAGMAPPTAPDAGPAQETGDMDWSYLVSGYQDAGGLQGFGNFGPFGNPMGGMGGIGGPGGANMFGSG